MVRSSTIGPFADGGVHELVPREGPARLAQQALEQAKLGRRQVQLACRRRVAWCRTRSMRTPRCSITSPASAAALDAALQRLDPLQQHLDAERLGHVVVGPHREADDLVGLLGLGGQHEDRDVARALAGAQLAADFQAAHARQHQVEDDEVGQQRLGLAQAFLAVVGDDGLVALALEVVGQHLGQGAFVFDDQDARLAMAVSDLRDWCAVATVMQSSVPAGQLIPSPRRLRAGGGRSRPSTR